jgi:hypothetical protein
MTTNKETLDEMPRFARRKPKPKLEDDSYEHWFGDFREKVWVRRSLVSGDKDGLDRMTLANISVYGREGNRSQPFHDAAQKGYKAYQEKGLVRKDALWEFAKDWLLTGDVDDASLEGTKMKVTQEMLEKLIQEEIEEAFLDRFKFKKKDNDIKPHSELGLGDEALDLNKAFEKIADLESKIDMLLSQHAEGGVGVDESTEAAPEEETDAEAFIKKTMGLGADDNETVKLVLKNLKRITGG